MSLLPLLAKGPSITTNFDGVLESAFDAAGLALERTITGREPDNVIRAMHRNEHVLIKIHGDWSDRTARVFTGLEYDRHYGPEGIPTLARIMFTSRGSTVPHRSRRQGTGVGHGEAGVAGAVRQVLRTRSLLVLGSSLRDPHVQQLVRSCAGSSRVIKTWADAVTKNAAQYWSAAGVDLVERDLAQFVPDLRRELQQLL